METNSNFMGDWISTRNLCMKYSGSMRWTALYNYKNFNDSHCLNDEHSYILEHGDIVWAVDPNNITPFKF